MNTQKKRKLHGSVLLTVVFVMSILIVFLFGTLALALAANNRAHVNYSSAQTSITARSVAESAVAALDKNVAGAKEYKDAVGALGADSTEPLTVKVGLSNPSGDSLTSMGKQIDDVTITYAGKKKFFKDGKWEDRDLLKFTSNVTMSGVTSTASVYVLKQEKGDGPSDNGGGAGFITTGGAKLTSNVMVVGGMYVGIPTLAEANNFKYDTHEDFINSFKKADGSIKIKPLDVSISADNPPDETLLLGRNEDKVSADAYICGNLYLYNAPKGIIFPDKSKGVTVWGDMYFTTNAISHFTYIYKGSKGNMNFTDVPYMYVDGHIFGQDGRVKLGNKDDPFPLNTFCGSIDSTHQESILATNIYCMDEDKTSTISACNNTLYMWSGSVIKQLPSNGSMVVNGEVCSKGDLVLENCEIAGDVRVQGKLTIKGTVKVNGDVVVAGDIDGEDNLELADGKQIYDNTVGGKSIELPNAIGQYIKRAPELNEDGKWVDIQGTPLNLWPVIQNGEFHPEGQGNYVAMDDDGNWKIVWEETSLHISTPWDITLYYPADGDGNLIVDENGKVISSLVLCDKMNLPKDFCFVDGTDEEFYAFTDVDVFNSETDYTLSVDYSKKAKKAKPTFTYKYVEEGNEAPAYTKYLESHGENYVYPEYAERKVILGLEDLTDKDDKIIEKSNYHIVKTIDQILSDEKFSNPYNYEISIDKTDNNNSIMPDKIKELSDSLSNDYITKAEDLEYDTEKNCLKITKSCRLDINGIGANLSDGRTTGDTFYIDPGKDEIVIFVKNLTFNNYHKVLVNDEQGGKVHIVIEKDGTMGGTSMGRIITKTYMDLLDAHSGEALKFDSSAATPGLDVAAEQGKAHYVPNVYIYGEKGGTLSIGNFDILTANILSPSLSVKIAATSSSYEIYSYNEPLNDSPVILGCMNAGDFDSDNTINVVYTDANKGGNVHNEDDDPFWYKILYYSEF